MFDNAWYSSLMRSSLTPPSWIFGPAWTVLYLLMGIAAVVVLRKGWQRREVKVALSLFLIQLAFNLVWSVFFFSWHMPGLALIDIGLLWIAIVATMFAFARVSRGAAWLMLPYLLWVSFASYLNYAIWTLN
jgi:tryptophan-rich sensory protein